MGRFVSLSIPRVVNDPTRAVLIVCRMAAALITARLALIMEQNGESTMSRWIMVLCKTSLLKQKQ